MLKASVFRHLPPVIRLPAPPGSAPRPLGPRVPRPRRNDRVVRPIPGPPGPTASPGPTARRGLPWPARSSRPAGPSGPARSSPARSSRPTGPSGWHGPPRPCGASGAPQSDPPAGPVTPHRATPSARPSGPQRPQGGRPSGRGGARRPVPQWAAPHALPGPRRATRPFLPARSASHGIRPGRTAGDDIPEPVRDPDPARPSRPASPVSAQGQPPPGRGPRRRPRGRGRRIRGRSRR